jgi:hypothetical protein
MPDPNYPPPPHPTVDDRDPESATTDALVAMAHAHRESQPLSCWRICRWRCGRYAIMS